jgi:voltage-gated potassium channel Kch
MDDVIVQAKVAANTRTPIARSAMAMTMRPGAQKPDAYLLLDNKNIEALRSNGHHVILADAARDATLSLAKVEDSAAMLCLTENR